MMSALISWAGDMVRDVQCVHQIFLEVEMSGN